MKSQGDINRSQFEEIDKKFKTITSALEEMAQGSSEQDGNIEVVLSEGGLEAYLVITPPKPGVRPLDLERIVSRLREEGIVGIDEERIKVALRNGEFTRPILVARGIPPTKGKEAYLASRVMSGEDVIPDQLLAVKIPPTIGEPGRSVKGEVIPGLLGDDIIIIGLENVRISDDGLRVYATEYGEVEWEENKVRVKAISAPLQILFEDMEDKLEALERSLKEIRPTRSNLDGRAEITISGDGLEAYITLIPPKIGGNLITMEDVVISLKEKGIVKDVDYKTISNALEKHRFNTKFLIAKGVPPTKGKDAYFIYRFGIDKDGNNLKERAIVGQLLMVKEPATYGSSGMTVTGEVIPGQLGEPLEITPGNGVILSDDNTRAYATTQGQVIWEEDRLLVEEVKEIDGDLTPDDGDIDFNGRVIINGNVRDRATINAQSDIIIHGGVGDATLICGGSIRIEQTVLGKGWGRIEAKGDMICHSAEGALINLHGDLITKDSLKRCNVNARRILCGGQIQEGEYTCEELIEAKILGSSTKAKTTLRLIKPGRISSRETVYPGVELRIRQATLNIKGTKQGVSFELDGSSIKEGPYTKTEIKKEEPTLLKKKVVKLSDLVPSVVVDCTSLEEGRNKGATLLGLPEDKVDIQMILKDKETIKARVFPIGVFGPWEKDESLKGSLNKDRDGYYQLTNRREGLFLTVFPPQGDGVRVKTEDILREIKAKEFKGINDGALKKAVSEAQGIPVKIAERQPSELDGEVKIEISPDKKKAELILIPPRPGGIEVSLEDVLKALKEKGVVAGIKEEVIKEAIKEKMFNKPIVVAEEIPPVEGTNYEIKYHFDTTPPRIRFPEDEWGRVDLRGLNIIQYVTQGQILATKTGSATLGIPGRRITGEEIPPPRLEEIKLVPGKNTEVSPDGLKLYATISGYVHFTNERVNVEPVYEIKGDVNLTTGNIEFAGSVDITGNVEDGFRVWANGDIQIKGGVGRVTLSAGGSINISQGIQANYEGKIWAGKDIICKFVEMGDLSAGGDIIVPEEILHSEINAGGSVIVRGKRGAIIGGRIRAKDRVAAKVIGCGMNTPTIIEVGVLPKIREQISIIRELLNKDLKRFERLKFDILSLRHKRDTKGLPPEREELLSELVDTQNVILSRLHSLTQRKEMLEREIVTSSGVVDGIETVYPGVVIAIGNAIFVVMEEVKSTTFYLEGGEIRQRPYTEK